MFNNPYAYTDPTGMIGQKERMWAGAIIAIVASIWTGGASMGWWATSMTATQVAAVAVAAAFVGGAITTQSLKGGLLSAFGAALTFGIGAVGNYYEWENLARASAQALAGGVMGSLQGGEFGSSFVAAGITAALMPGLRGVGPIRGAVAGAIIGGTMSEVTGGKFANGAISGAIQGAMAGGVGGRRSGPGAAPGKATLKVGQSRPMTEGEIAMTQEVFGDDVDYSKARVFNRKFAFFQQRGTAMSPDGNIYFHPTDYMDDFSLADVSSRSWFMHEATHVWQNQQGINVYGAVLDRTYDYRPLTPGKSFQSYGLEQQGDIVQDYYLLRNGYRANWSGYSTANYEAVLPFGK